MKCQVNIRVNDVIEEDFFKEETEVKTTVGNVERGVLSLEEASRGV